MYDQVLSGLKLILSVLPKFNFDSVKRRSFAGLIKSLYLQIIDILENGQKILLILSKYNDGELVDSDELFLLLKDQRELIAKSNTIIENQQFKEVLLIHLPALKPLPLLVGAKDRGVELLLDKIEDWQEDLVYKSVEKAKDSLKLLGAEFDAPSRHSISNSMMRLEEISQLLETLRTFLVEKFKLEELL